MKKILIFIVLAVVALLAFIRIKPKTSDWKTYINSEYSYSFEYPDNGKVVPPETSNGYTFVYIYPNSDGGKMNIRVFDNPNSLSAKDFYKSLAKEAENDFKAGNRPPPIPPKSEDEIEVNGLIGYQTRGNFAGDGSIRHTYLTDGNIVLDVSYYDEVGPNDPNTDKYLEVFEQILHTFRFSN